MTLHLDARRAAMLREMGLRLLPPMGEPTGAAQVLATAPAAIAPAANPMPAVQPPAPAIRVATADQALPPELATLGWRELEAAVRAFGNAAATGAQAVFGTGPQRANWMVVGDAPGETEDPHDPFAGPAGTLLDNMLRAIGLERAGDVYSTSLLKCRPPGGRNPEPEDLVRWEPFLRRQVALVQPRVLLVMGRFAAQTLLQTQEPIGRLRGSIHRYADVPVVITYPPAYLLRNLPDKAKAWADLCLAQDLLKDAQAASGR